MAPALREPTVARENPIFTYLVESNPRPRRGKSSLPISAAIHALVPAITLLVLPLYWSESLPPRQDPLKGIIWAPPAAAAAALQKGSEAGETRKVLRPPEPRHPDEVPSLVEPPIEVPPERPLETVPSLDKVGDPDGSELGNHEGQPGGVPGGQPGGVPGGVPGGCPGCDGQGLPDLSPDEAPRIISQVNPMYPTDAFIKNIEGTVLVEAIVDIDGRVVNPRIVRSIPILDAAALACVRQWVFAPARHHGVRVATVIRAPIQFHIY